MHTLGALAALAVLVSPVSDVVSTTPRHKFHTLPELLKAMEASPVKYGISGLDKLRGVPADSFAKRLWPQLVEPLEMPRVTRDASGKRSIVSWPVPDSVEPLLAESERLYAAKDFKGAAVQYRKILELAPDFYLAEASLGDCAFFSGDPKTALEHYDAALRRNPDDYRLHFYRGNALMASGKKKEAIDAFTTSLMLKPRNPILMKHLRQQQDRLGIKVQPDLLVPRGFARRAEDGIEIYVDMEAPYWLGWACCKGLWLGEPAHREEMTGTSAPGWSTLEDMECLGALAMGYASSREQRKAATDPALETVVRVIKDYMGGALVVYELGSRIDPQIGLKIDPKFRDLYRRYVRKYVLGVGHK